MVGMALLLLFIGVASLGGVTAHAQSDAFTVRIVEPSTSPQSPIVTDQDQTVNVSVEVTVADGATLDELRLNVNGVTEAMTTSSSLQYDLVLDAAGRYDVDVIAEGTDGTGSAASASESFYAVRTKPDSEIDQSVPAGTDLGINELSDTAVRLVLQVPSVEKAPFVHVIGEFSDWEVRPEHEMNREINTASTGQDSVLYWYTLDGLTPGQEVGFQYLVNGQIRVADPYSEKLLSGNDQFISPQTYPDLKPYPGEETSQLVSVLETGQTDFSFTPFERPEQKDLVIYELLIRDFIANHDYQTMQDTLGYLKNLGVNAIELMPVSEFDGNLSWGYNPAFYFAPDKYYGPAKELKRFIDLAHQEGIAIILDVVYNQATGQSPFVRLDNDSPTGDPSALPTSSNPWVNREARHPFNVFNDNNHESTFTQYWLDRANAYWLNEFNVDGFRFDLSKGFTQFDSGGDVGLWSSYDQSRIDLLTRMADEIWSVDDRAYVILEHFAAQDEEKVLAEYRTGEGLPGMMLWNNMNDPYNEASMGYPESSNLQNTYYRNRNIDVPNYVTYMESHDEQWMMYRNRAFGNSTSDGSYDVTELETALERQKMVGALFFTIPGPRMLWQFGELGYGFGDNGEQCLRDADCPDSAPGRTGEKPIRWDYFDAEQSPNRVALYEAWSAMINLRQQNEVFRATNTLVSIEGDGTPERRIELQHPTMDVVIVANAGVTPTGVVGDFSTDGTWYDFFSGASITIDPGEAADAIPLSPGQFHIFTSEPVATPEAGLVPFGVAAPAPNAPANLTAAEDLQNETVELTWDASTAVDVTGYRIYRGQSVNFDTTGASIATVGPSETSFADETAESGVAYRYRVVATDNDQQVSLLSNEVTALLYPNSLPVNVSRTFGDGTASSNYRLIALPCETSQPVAETFTGEVGDAWDAYWDDGSDTDFLVRFDNSNTFTFAPGRGFWGIANEPWTVQQDIPTVDLRSRSGELFITVPVHPGWNIISNPLDRDLRWNAVQAANDGLTQPIWRFDGSFQEVNTFASAQSGEAFYYNNIRGSSFVELPYGQAASSASLRAEKDAPSYLTLTARVTEGPDLGVSSRIAVGSQRGALGGVDEADVIAPPPSFEAVSLLVTANDANARARQRLLKRSVQAPSADGHAYDLDLRAEPGTLVELRADNLPPSQAVRLVNRANGETVDLNTESSVTWTVQKENTALTLLAGTDAFVKAEQKRLLPDDLTLWPNYPNPFTRSTTIEYTIPKDAHVQLQVYDILGRRVATLVDERQASGLHTVQWNGTGGSGQPLASGIYFGRIIVDGQTATRKMTLVR